MNAILVNNFEKFIKKKLEIDVKSKLLEYYYDLASVFSKKVATELPPYRPSIDYEIYLKDN